MWKCGGCGTENGESESRCRKCGRAKPAADDPPGEGPELPSFRRNDAPAHRPASESAPAGDADADDGFDFD